MSNINMKQKEQLQRGRKFITRLEHLQYKYFNGRPQWTNIKFNDLKLFMAYTLYGSPFSSYEDNEISMNDDIFEYYKAEEKLRILTMVKVIKQNIIKKNVSNLDVGTTFTHSICKMKCDVCHNFPDQDIHQWRLLRIKLDNTDVVYIDLYYERTYKDWNDYKDNNTLPQGFMFFPEFGYYEESKYLLQNLTPCSRKKERILSSVDIVGRTSSFVSSILITGGLLFPIMVPVLLPASFVAGSCSLWDFGRQVNILADIFQHDQPLFSKNTAKHWYNLAIAALGAITAPMNATLKLTKSEFLATNIGKSLCLIQKGSCIVQCSFEFFRFFVKINDGKFTLKDMMLFRLDLFVVLGFLLPIFEIENILKFIISSVPTMAMVMSKKILEFPYCVSRHIEVVCFVQKHVTMFMSQLKKCLCGQLTLDKCLLAWRYFQKYLTTYKKKTSMLTPTQMLEHIVNDTDLVSRVLPNKLEEELSDIKRMLCGVKMCRLLEQLNADQTAMRFYVGYILDKAKAMSELYIEIVYECLNQGKMNIDQINREFCKMYELESCQMIEYVSFAIREAVLNINEYVEAYKTHKSKSENNYDELMTASGSIGSQSIHTYDILAPCSKLDSNICKEFAQVFDSQNHKYTTSYKYSEPEPNVSILFSITNLSVKIVFFSINIVDELPMLSISFYQDSQGSVDNIKQ